MVSAGLLKQPLDVARRRPCRTFAAARVDRDVSHIGPARLPVVAIITDGCGCGPLKALLELVAAPLTPCWAQ
jgi:hypothetical protein